MSGQTTIGQIMDSQDMAQEMAKACAAAMWRDDAASVGLGMRLISVSQGRSVVEMPITAAMVNGHDTCHGGFIFALADSAFAFACNTYNQRSVAQSCHITYLAPGMLGDVLTATAVEVSRSGRSGVYDVKITRADGTHLAEFRGLCRTIKGVILEGAA